MDVADRAAYSMEVVQAPSDKEGTLVGHYVSIIENRLEELLSYTKYLAVDGCFMKKNSMGPPY
jgi:hypothetical protein